MGNLTVATIFVVMLNVMMWFSTLAIAQVNPDGLMCYNVSSSVIGSSVTSSGGYYVNEDDIIGDLPTSESTSIAPSSTSFNFIDVFGSLLSWAKTAPGIKYLYYVVAAPTNILNCMGLPHQFAVGIGVLWYMVTFLILVAFLAGRD